MRQDKHTAATQKTAHLFTAADIAAILGEQGWLSRTHVSSADRALTDWLARAAELLGPRAVDRAALLGLLALVFNYRAVALLEDAANQEVLARAGAREVIRELANRVLDGMDIDSDRFKRIVEGMKSSLPYRSRSLFHPIRLALAGSAGEGELDRVILLLDAAARLDFMVPVKSTRERMLEFCAALD
jgi:hypothetical protein